MLAFPCPHCGVRVQVENRCAGRRVQCSGCGRTVEAPDDSGSLSLSAEGRAARHGTGTASPPYRGRGDDATEMVDGLDVRRIGVNGKHNSNRRRASSGSSRMLLPFLAGCCIMVGLGLVCLAGVGLWWFLRDPPSTTSSAKAPVVKHDDGQEKPAVVEPGPQGEGRWTVLFRSDNPALWNTLSNGRDYAVPLDRAPAAIRYLRLRRMDTREALIVPVTRAQLNQSNLPPEGGGYSWNGTAKLEWGGLHLGIAQGMRHKFPAPEGIIIIAYENWDVWIGSGFGHKCFKNDVQYFAWQGHEIGRTAFEIAVTDQELSDDEKRILLTK